MKKYKYRTVFICKRDLEQFLNELGGEGYELKHIAYSESTDSYTCVLMKEDITIWNNAKEIKPNENEYVIFIDKGYEIFDGIYNAKTNKWIHHSGCLDEMIIEDNVITKWTEMPY